MVDDIGLEPMTFRTSRDFLRQNSIQSSPKNQSPDPIGTD